MSSIVYVGALAKKTRPIYEVLSKHAALESFVLVGGTAIALQTQHRLSEDLDFWLPGPQLSSYLIEHLMRELQAQGYKTTFATSPAAASSFRINTGHDLRRFSQDWVIDGVKVQFFSPQDVAYEYFQHFPRLDRMQTATSFEIMSLEGLLAMKAYTIHRRTRSRDLVDLWHFLSNGKTLAEILQAGVNASPSVSVDYAKKVLRGDIPLDLGDEGFELLRPGLAMATVYADFAAQIDALEVAQAREVAERHAFFASQHLIAPKDAK